MAPFKTLFLALLSFYAPLALNCADMDDGKQALDSFGTTLKQVCEEGRLEELKVLIKDPLFKKCPSIVLYDCQWLSLRCHASPLFIKYVLANQVFASAPELLDVLEQLGIATRDDSMDVFKVYFAYDVKFATVINPELKDVIAKWMSHELLLVCTSGHKLLLQDYLHANPATFDDFEVVDYALHLSDPNTCSLLLELFFRHEDYTPDTMALLNSHIERAEGEGSFYLAIALGYLRDSMQSKNFDGSYAAAIQLYCSKHVVSRPI